MNRTQHYHLVTALIIFAAGVLYLLSADAHKVGFYHDDGIYVVTAKSLVTGSGYRIASLPGEPHQTKYPPLYPILLSVAWFVNPNFPSNAILLIVPSIIATLLCLFIVRTYLVEELGASDLIAISAVAFFAFNTRTILLASSAMSEALFTVLSVSALWAAAAHIRTPSVRTALISAVLVGALTLTRSSGIVLLMAIGIFALVRHKLSAALPVLIAGALVFAAWVLWAQTHVLNPGNPSLTFYTSYFGQFRERYQLLGSGGFALLLVENAFMLIPVSVPLVFLGLGYSAIPGLQPQLIAPALFLLFAVFAIIAVGFFRHLRRGLDLIHVYTGCYLLFHVVWPYSSYDRFIMPLLPFIAFFFIYEMADLIARFKPWIAVLGTIALFWLYVNATEIWKDAVQSRKNFAARSEHDEQLAAWIRRNTRPSDVFLCYPDPLYYLRTDRKAIAAEVSLMDPSPDPQSLLRQLEGLGSQYIIENDREQLAEFRPDIGIKGVPALLRSHPDSFVPVFSEGSATIYRVVSNY